MGEDERPVGWCKFAISSDYEAQLALAQISRRREAEKELTDRAFRAALESAARWFDQFPQASKVPFGRICAQLRSMKQHPNDFFFEEEDKKYDADLHSSCDFCGNSRLKRCTVCGGNVCTEHAGHLFHDHLEKVR